MTKKIIIFCSGAQHFNKKIKNSDIGDNEIEIFPDGEFNQSFSKNLNLKGRVVCIIQSFYKDEKFTINDRVFEALSCYYNAKSLGAKKIFLIAPYFPYLRQDKRFKKNQTISSKVMAKLFSVFNKVYIFEPHLHRFKKFSEFFPNAQAVSLDDFLIPEIKKIKKKSKKILLIGPDSESAGWVKPIKQKFDLEYVTMTKKRFSPIHVEIKRNKKLAFENIIVIDDIISTGKTIFKSIQNTFSKKTYVFAFHGVFTDKKTLSKLKKKVNIIITNSIPRREKGVRVVDVSWKIWELVRGGLE